MKSSRVEKRFWPKEYDKLPRKIKKSIKKWRFGYYSTSNFHGIYRCEKKGYRFMKSLTKIIRRGHFIWVYNPVYKTYWKILHIYK